MATRDEEEREQREAILIQVARLEGKIEGLQFSLDWLEKRYVEKGPKQPERGSAQGQALLVLANELAKAVREEKAKMNG